MKAVIVLLANERVQQLVHDIAGQLEQEHAFPLVSALLPAHLSLKQGFEYEHLARLEEYCAFLASEVRPVRISLDRFYLWSDSPVYGVLGLNAVETGTLRGLHNRLNNELGGVVRDPSAPYDGDDYHFHITIEIARDAASLKSLKKVYESLPKGGLDLGFIASELGLFVNREEDLLEVKAFKLQKIFLLTGGRR